MAGTPSHNPSLRCAAYKAYLLGYGMNLAFDRDTYKWNASQDG